MLQTKSIYKALFESISFGYNRNIIYYEVLLLIKFTKLNTDLLFRFIYSISIQLVFEYLLLKSFMTLDLFLPKMSTYTPGTFPRAVTSARRMWYPPPLSAGGSSTVHPAISCRFMDLQAWLPYCLTNYNLCHAYLQMYLPLSFVNLLFRSFSIYYILYVTAFRRQVYFAVD